MWHKDIIDAEKHSPFGYNSTQWDNSRIRHTSVEIATGDVLQLNSTPYEIIAAPGADKIIKIVDGMISLDYNSAAYVLASGVSRLDLVYTGGSNYTHYFDANFLKLTADAHQYILFSPGSTIEVNKAIDLTCSADPTTGNSPIYIDLWYEIVDKPF